MRSKGLGGLSELSKVLRPAVEPVRSKVSNVAQPGGRGGKLLAGVDAGTRHRAMLASVMAGSPRRLSAGSPRSLFAFSSPADSAAPPAVPAVLGFVPTASPLSSATPAGVTDPGDRYVDSDQAALFAFAEYFDVIDGARTRGTDGKVYRGDLEYVVDHPDEFEPEVVEVAQYLLDNPELMDSLDGANDGGDTDGHIWRSDLAVRIAGETPPPGLSAAQQADFVSIQLDAAMRAVDRDQLSLSESLALVDDILASAPTDDPEFALALDWQGFSDETSITGGPAFTAVVLDRVTADMSAADLDAVLGELEPVLTQAHTRLIESSVHGDARAVQLFYRSLVAVSERAGDVGIDALARVLAEPILQRQGDDLAYTTYLDVLRDLGGELSFGAWDGQGMRLTGGLLRVLVENGAIEAATDIGLQAQGAISRMVEGDVASYVGYAEWLALAEQHRDLFIDAQGNFDEDAFEAARDAMMAEQFGEGWYDDFTAVQARLAEHGESLLELLEGLQAVPPGSEQAAAAAELIGELLDDPNVEAAIGAALQTNPELLTGERGEALLDFFSTVQLGGKGARVAQMFANLYIDSLLAEGLTSVRAGDLASAERLIAQLEGLRDSRLASILGVGSDKLDDAVAVLQDPELLGRLISGDEAIANEAQKDLQGRLQRLGFSDKGVASRILRGIGFAAAAVAFVDKVGGVLDDPSVQSGLEALAAGAGLVKSGGDFLRVLGVVDDSHVLARYGVSSAATKILGTVGALFEVWNAIGEFDDARHGDLNALGRGGLHVASAGGIVLTTFASGGWAIVGLGITVGAGFLFGRIDAAEYANRFESDAFETFLAASGLSAEAADTLHDTSGESYSVVPLLLQYGQMRGLTVAETIEWINGLEESGDLTKVRQALHHTLDAIDGDLTAFTETAEGDDGYVPRVTGGITSASDPVLPAHAPRSAAQFDEFLESRGIATP